MSTRSRFPGSVAISARTGEGVATLVQALEDELGSWRLRSRFRVPLTEAGLIAEIHRIGHVLELHYEDEFALIVAHVPAQLEQKLSAFAIDAEEYAPLKRSGGLQTATVQHGGLYTAAPWLKPLTLRRSVVR